MSKASGSISIAIDAMGGDLGPKEVVTAASLVLAELKDQAHLILVGQEQVLAPLVQAAGLSDDARLSILHAPQIIEMHDKPKESHMKKKDSSMLMAMDLVKKGDAQLMISSGNTKSLVFSGTLMLKKMPGVERAALATIMPADEHHFIMLDVGSEPETTAIQLVHNAILGSQYYKSILSVERPRVGLLTIGTEEGKGTKRIVEAHEMLKQLGDVINYVGLIEGFDTFKNVADVVVCDGFTGNVVLKCLESCYTTLGKKLKERLYANPVRMLGASMCKGAFRELKQQFSPEQYAGAPLLGLRSLVLKAHGSSNSLAFKGAILIGLKAHNLQMGQQTEKDIEKANSIMKAGKVPAKEHEQV